MQDQAIGVMRRSKKLFDVDLKYRSVEPFAWDNMETWQKWNEEYKTAISAVFEMEDK